MNGTSAKTIRTYSMLLILAVGLTACKGCSDWKNKLPFFRKKPEIIHALPPEIVGEVPPDNFVPVDTNDNKDQVATLPDDKQARPGPDNPPVPELALKTVHFDYDSAVLTDVARRVLDENVAWLKANGTVAIQIEGHCDERGTEEYNMNLGARRAKTVMQYLMRNGIAENRLFTISFGEQAPVDPGHDESAWWKNRRVEFARLSPM